MSPLGYVLAISGSLFAILALCVGLLERFSNGKLLAFIRPFARRFRFRKSKSVNDNHRQAWFVFSTLLLFILSIMRGNVVYIALETLLGVSTVLWYVRVHSKEETSDTIKEWVRVAIAIGIWVFLEVQQLVPGFHRIGVIGLELLGCAFIVARWERLRELLQLLGGILIAAYGVIGIFLEPERAAEHATWGGLNVVFSVFAIILLFGPRKPTCETADFDANAE